MHDTELQELLQDKTGNIWERYTELYRILQSILAEGTAGSQMDFSGPFARLTWLAEKTGIDPDLRHQLNSVRVRCQQLREQDEEELSVLLPFDIRATAELWAALHHQPVPQGLADLLPRTKLPPHQDKRQKTTTRVCVTDWDEERLHAIDENQVERTVSLKSLEKGSDGWEYLNKLIRKGSQLNLIHPTARKGVLYPELIILEPDYLADISTIASCFQEYGTTPYALLIQRMQANQPTGAILLGNIAGQMLDEEINNTSDESVKYADSALRFMHHNALKLLACQEDLKNLHQNATQQQQNIRHILKVLKEEDKAFDADHALLEPSFFCETLGLQGRMDLLQDDYRVLIEQKSGKKEFTTGGHQEKHYVQMLLYLAVLHYGFRRKNGEVNSYLLYSKYTDGLIKEGAAPHLLYEAMRIRNQLVWMEYELSRGGSRRIIDALNPERLRTRSNIADKFWERYLFPTLSEALLPFQTATPVEHAYYHRMMTFIAREHLLSKIGTPGREGSGMASLWNSTLEEKRLAGNIYVGLTVCTPEPSAEGIERLALQIPEEGDDYRPNFRVGDAVILYSYPKGKQPDARSGVVHRCSIDRIEGRLIWIQLRFAQKNRFVFRQKKNQLWAIEHDTVESSFGTLYRSLYSLLTARDDRRNLLLGQRAPEYDWTITLTGDYGTFTPLVMKARQAQDYFLLIGPPGTGKTSFGLMNIVQETLDHPDETILLLSYTNRAVDEICSKLVSARLPFMRIGSRQSCPPAYHNYLMAYQAHACPKLSDFASLLGNTRIVVGTTTAISSRPELFTLKAFDVAIIDEASQILEPHILGILCARHNGANAVRKFVLIGDHKQLPAVVQQDASESAVTEDILHGIGLTDCRESLFQRLLRMQEKAYPDGDSPFIYRFTRQGRMHPEVAAFASRHFYDHQLNAVPLPHQAAALHFPQVDENDEMQRLLSGKRFVFQPSASPGHSDSPTTTPIEAQMIAQVVRAVYTLYIRNSRPFSAEESIGIIVPYRHQIAAVHHELEKLNLPALDGITIDTVERYQGSQRDVIVYGFTVQHPYQLDFLCSQSFQEHGITIDRKLNVALTRAKEQTVLIGNPDLLSLDPVHRQLLDYITSECK